MSLNFRDVRPHAHTDKQRRSTRVLRGSAQCCELLGREELRAGGGAREARFGEAQIGEELGVLPVAAAAPQREGGERARRRRRRRRRRLGRAVNATPTESQTDQKGARCAAAGGAPAAPRVASRAATIAASILAFGSCDAGEARAAAARRARRVASFARRAIWIASSRASDARSPVVSWETWRLHERMVTMGRPQRCASTSERPYLGEGRRRR